MARRTAAAEETHEDIPQHHPRLREQLLGHDPCEHELLDMIQAGRLPHALLLTGPRGIGKATLAYRLARFLLAPPQDAGGGLFGDALPAPQTLSIPSSHPVFRRVAIGAHSDLLVLEAEDIKVEQTRQVAQFLSLTPGESQWRVVIIDSIDAMNRNAANALLKTLEEPPPHTVLILISHNPGLLLPTIRSRCRRLRLAPLDDAAFIKVMGQVSPAFAAEEHHVWSLLSGASPGVAMALMDAKADKMYKELLELLVHPATLRLHAFADSLALKNADREFRAFARLLLWLPARIMRHHGMEVFAGEADLLATLAASPPPVWTDWWEMAGKLLADTQHLHLDRKTVILTLLRAPER